VIIYLAEMYRAKSVSGYPWGPLELVLFFTRYLEPIRYLLAERVGCDWIRGQQKVKNTEAVYGHPSYGGGVEA